jgi:hypothetical protein
MMRPLRILLLPLLLLALCAPGASGAADTGFLVRSACTEIAAPVVNKTWCSNQTDGQIYVWKGGEWQLIGWSDDIGLYKYINQGEIYRDGATTAGNTSVTIPSATFTGAEVGDYVYVANGGGTPVTVTDAVTYAGDGDSRSLVPVTLSVGTTPGALDVLSTTSPTANFASGDLGKTILVTFAGTAGTHHQTTIAEILSPSSIRMTDAAPVNPTYSGMYMAGALTVSSDTAAFVPSDQGKGLILVGAGPGGTDLVATIGLVMGDRWVRMDTAAAAAATGQTAHIRLGNLITTVATVTPPHTIGLTAAPTTTQAAATVSIGSDVTARVQAYLASSSRIFIPAGVYFVSNLRVVKDHSEIYGQGNKSIFLSLPGTTGALLSDGGNTVNLHDFAMFGGDDSERQNLATPDSGQDGLWITPTNNSRVHNVTVTGFGGAGLRTIGGGRYRTPNLIVDDSTFSYNWTGIYGGDNSDEYTIWTGNHVSYNRYAIRIASGNTTWVNNTVNDNGYGVVVTGTGLENSAHGNWVGGLINHSSVYSIYAVDALYGMNFQSCQIHVGNLYLLRSAGITISGELNVSNIYLEGGGRNYLINNFINTEYFNIIHHNYNGSADDTIFLNNFTAAGRIVGQGAYLTTDYRTTGYQSQFFEPFAGTTLNRQEWKDLGTVTQSGSLAIAGDGSNWTTNGVTGNRSFARTATLSLQADLTLASTSDACIVGFTSAPDAVTYTNMPHAILVQPNSGNLRVFIFEKGASKTGATGAALSAATPYRLRIDVLGAGSKYYISADAGATWTLYYNGSGSSLTDSPMYVRALAKIGTCTLGNVAVSTGFSANGAVPQAVYAVGAAAPAGGTGAAAGAWDTAAHRDSAITLLNNMRDALIKVGILKP